MKNKLRMIVDTVLIAALAAICCAGSQAQAAHELLGIVFTCFLVLHLVLNSKTLFRGGSARVADGLSRNGLRTLNLLTGIVLLVNIVSGFMVSELLPALLPVQPWMMQLHSGTYIMLLVLVAGHVAAHYSWIKAMAQKLSRQRGGWLPAAALAVVIIGGSLLAGHHVDNALASDVLPAPAAVEQAKVGEESGLPVFDAATLAQYDGKDGQPAYMAVDGVVYDVSECFRNGRHKGYSAGMDLSAAFNDEHSSAYLDGLDIVGAYQE